MQIQKNMANIIKNLGIEYLKIDASQNEQSIKEQIIKFICCILQFCVLKTKNQTRATKTYRC